MKVLNVLFDDRFGGPQKRVFTVARLLRSNNIETIVCLPDRNKDIENVASEYHIKLIRVNISRLPRLNKWLSVIPWLFTLYRDILVFRHLIEAEQPDLIHINGAIFVAPAIAAKLARTPLAWHLNDTVLPPFIAFMAGIIVQSLADEIIVSAKAVASYYKIKRNFAVIYPPVSVKLFATEHTSRDENNSGIINIGTIANWNPLKGLEYFVEAISIVVKKHDLKVKGIIGGARLDGYKSYADSIDVLINKNKLENIISCPGYISDVPAFLNKIDCFILTSISEACPIVILEAMAAGIPVIATDVGGNRELILPNTINAAGIIVPSRDPEAVADAVLKIINDHNLIDKMGKNGRKLVSERYSLEICGEKHMSIYTKYS